MVASKPLASRGQPTWRVEVPEEIVASGASSGKTAPITTVLVSHRYDGQIAIVLTGTLIGSYFNVQTNNANSITFEETVGASIVLNDRIAVSTWGQPPGSTPDAEGNITDYFGPMLSTVLPMLKRNFFEGRYHGSDEMPAIEEIVPMSNEYASDYSIVLKNCAILAMAFGDIEESTTDFDAADPAQLISTDTYPGSYTVMVAASANYTVGDLVLLDGGVGGTSEVGKIASKPGGTSIKLVHPCKNFHKAGAGVHAHEIKCTTPGVPDTVITHILRLGWNLPTITYEAGLRRETRWTGQDMVFQFMGLMASKMALKSSPGEDPLMLSLGVQGLHWRYQKADGITDLNEVSAKVEVGFDTGVWLPCACTITFNGVGYQEAAEFNASLEREIDSKVLHDAGDIPYSRTGDPKVHYEGNPKVAMDVMLPLKNRNIIELLADDTEFEASWVYARGTYEELTVCMQGCHLNGPLMDEWPEEGAIPQNADCIARKMYIQVKDFVPYYVA